MLNLPGRLVRALRRRLTFSENDAIHHALGRRTGTMLDVGAHHGTAHRSYLQEGWTVYAFEPDPENRTRLTSHPHLIVSDCAIGAVEVASSDFYTSSESTGISSLSAFTSGHAKRCTVRVTTLRRVVAERQIEKCDYLKIDTEGHDLFVLQGFPWDRLQPDAIMCEFEDRKTQALGYTYRELGDFLLTHNYVVFMSEWAPIVRYGIAHTWRRVVRYPETTLEAGAWGNFLAFREGVKLPWALRRVK